MNKKLLSEEMKDKFTLNESSFTETINNNLEIYKKVAQEVRDYLIGKYGQDRLQGKCIEASDKIVTKLNYYDIASTAVEGWVWYDYDDGCTDRPYDEHTWVETEDGYVIDVTADQFNSFVEEEYPEIIISDELPHNFSYDEDVLDDDLLTEAKNKKKKKYQYQQDPVFKSVKDMKKWVKKRQKGMSPWGSFNTNAGNVEVCNQFFNHVMSSGADGSSGLGVSNGGLSSPAASGDAGSGGGMGESFTIKESSSQPISERVKNIILQNQDLLNNDLKEFINHCVVTLDENEIIELFNLLLDAGVGVDIDMIASAKSYSKVKGN